MLLDVYFSSVRELLQLTKYTSAATRAESNLLGHKHPKHVTTATSSGIGVDLSK
jgi:hypothetical protein